MPKAKKRPITIGATKDADFERSYGEIFRPNHDAFQDGGSAVRQRTPLKFVPSYTTDGVNGKPVLVGFDDARMEGYSG